MRTFADLKRRIVVGTRIRMTAHSHADMPQSPVGTVRSVGLVQRNAIAFNAPEGHLSWLYWPKASGVKITGPDSFEISLDKPGLNSHVMRIAYEFVNEEAA